MTAEFSIRFAYNQLFVLKLFLCIVRQAGHSVNDTHTHADKCALCILTSWRGPLLGFFQTLSAFSYQCYFSEKHKKEWRPTVCALGVCHLESLLFGF